MSKQSKISLDLERKHLHFEGYDHGGRLSVSDWTLLNALHDEQHPLPGDFSVKGGRNGTVRSRSKELLRQLPVNLAAQLIMREGNSYRLGDAVECVIHDTNEADSADFCVPADFYIKMFKDIKPPETHMEMIGPELAREYLAANVCGPDERANRTKRKGQIARAVRSIRSGHWKLTHQGIGFDTAKRLVDGQHRLEAIIITGITVPMLVTRGLDPECYYGVDQGLRRTLADILALDKRLSEPLRFLSTLLLGRTQIASEEMEPIVQTPLLQAGERLMHHCSTHRSGFTGAAVRAAVLLAMVSRPQDEDYTLLLYSGLAKQTYNGMPTVAETYNRQLSQGTSGKRSPLTQMVRTLYMLDKNNADNSAIVINSDMVSRRSRLIREWLRDYIANPSAKPVDLLRQLGARQETAKKQQAQGTPLFDAADIEADVDDLDALVGHSNGKKSIRR